MCLGFIWLLQFGSDRGVLGFQFAVSLVLIEVCWGFTLLSIWHGFMASWLYGFMASWLHGLVSHLLEELFWLRVIFCSLFTSFPLGADFVPLCMLCRVDLLL